MIIDGDGGDGSYAKNAKTFKSRVSDGNKLKDFVRY